MCEILFSIKYPSNIPFALCCQHVPPLPVCCVQGSSSTAQVGQVLLACQPNEPRLDAWLFAAARCTCSVHTFTHLRMRSMRIRRSAFVWCAQSIRIYRLYFLKGIFDLQTSSRCLEKDCPCVCVCVWIICCLIFRNVKLPNDLQNSR